MKVGPGLRQGTGRATRGLPPSLPAALPGRRQRRGLSALPTANQASGVDRVPPSEDDRQPFESGPRICYSRDKTFLAGRQRSADDFRLARQGCFPEGVLLITASWSTEGAVTR